MGNFRANNRASSSLVKTPSSLEIVIEEGGTTKSEIGGFFAKQSIRAQK